MKLCHIYKCVFVSIGVGTCATIVTTMSSCSIKHGSIDISGDKKSNWSENAKIYSSITWKYYYDEDIKIDISTTNGYERYVTWSQTRKDNCVIISFNLVEPNEEKNGFNIFVDAMVGNIRKTESIINISDYTPTPINPWINVDLTLNYGDNIWPSNYSTPIADQSGFTTLGIVKNKYVLSTITKDEMDKIGGHWNQILLIQRY